MRVTNGKEESFACQREAPILSRRRLLFQQFGGAVHYSVTGLLLHWPPAHQTSGLSQGPRLATALPIPASTSPSPDQASCLWAPPAPDHPMCCVSGSLVIMFCLQGDELGKGVPGALSETREAERMVRRAAEADSRHCALGRGDTVSWTW